MPPPMPRPRPALLILFALGLALPAQDWPSHGNDSGGMRHSPLKQITPANVARLQVAWTYHTGDRSDGKAHPVRSAFEATPLVVNNVLYVTTPFCRLIALDAETGRELWVFDPQLDRDGPYSLYINRGAAYWTDGTRQRLFFGTLDARLFSIDAVTGKPDPEFGQGGWIDFRQGVADDHPSRAFGLTSPPSVYKDLVICGSLASDGDPLGPSGDIRAFDARTGRVRWRFHSVPRAGELGNDTWVKESWQGRGGVNAWSLLSVDDARGLVFVPLTSPATDRFGGDRHGANLFGNSLVALDAATGKRVWHYQTIHHDLWDWDLPAQPVLVTVRRNGRLVPAVAQVTKTGFVFLFHRETGEPLFPIEERPVPPSDVPGEAAWPTQPHPVKPPPFARQSMTAGELTTVTPESRRYCEKLIENAILGALFTPIGTRKTIVFPGTNGGANWGGASFDPATHTLYVNSMDVGMIQQMVPRQGTIPYRSRGFGTVDSRFWDPQLLPCQQPPWGHLTAIDLNGGEFRWRSVLGVVDALVAKGLPPTGAPNLGGSLVTAGGLVFIGATSDSRFRAFHKLTGKELWGARLPASAHASPMTFAGKRTRKQFVVIAAGGGNDYNATVSDALIAFALP